MQWRVLWGALGLWLLALGTILTLACSAQDTYPVQAGGITVYAKALFEQGWDGFTGSKDVEQKLVDGVAGKGLKTVSREKWAGPALSVDIQGSKDLKIAFLAKGHNFPRARLNVLDRKASDNTTPYGYRYLPDGEWTPVVYYLDRFRYNSKSKGYVNKDTQYSKVRFFGPKPGDKEVSLTLDNFVIYRGEDSQPPDKVKGLEAFVENQAVQVSWDQAEDNAATMTYVIARAEVDGAFHKIAQSHTTHFLDKTAGKGSYKYRVLACDYENNLGPWSDPVRVKSKTSGEARERTRLERDRRNYADHVRQVHSRGKGSVDKGHVCLYGDSLTHARVYEFKTESALGIYTVKAHGYPGKRTGFGKSHVEEILNKENPEYLLVLFGTNNVRGKMRDTSTLNNWMKDLKGIVRKAESRGTVAVLGTIPPRGFDDPESKPEAQFNRMLMEKAREWEVPVAYIFDSIQEAGERRQFIYKDGVHWTSEGMRVAAKAWGRTMDQVEYALRFREE